MINTIECTEEECLEHYFDAEALKSIIMETVLASTDQLSASVVSFAYVAIQKFIAHCKDHSIDPLTMSFEEIQKFVDDKLRKELNQEIKFLK